eukprot:9812320-Alexandrium_andersonii.AAC.1
MRSCPSAGAPVAEPESRASPGPRSPGSAFARRLRLPPIQSQGEDRLAGGASSDRCLLGLASGPAC